MLEFEASNLNRISYVYANPSNYETFTNVDHNRSGLILTETGFKIARTSYNNNDYNIAGRQYYYIAIR